MDGGKPITLKPAIRTTFLEADNNGNLTHQTEFLDTQEGKDAYDLYQNKVGGFSAAMTTVPKGVTEIPVSFTVLIMCLSQTLAAIVDTLCSLTAYLMTRFY